MILFQQKSFNITLLLFVFLMVFCSKYATIFGMFLCFFRLHFISSLIRHLEFGAATQSCHAHWYIRARLHCGIHGEGFQNGDEKSGPVEELFSAFARIPKGNCQFLGFININVVILLYDLLKKCEFCENQLENRAFLLY